MKTSFYSVDELKELAARIRELREVCGYTQEELAKELHIDVDTYRGYEESAADIPIESSSASAFFILFSFLSCLSPVLQDESVVRLLAGS